MPSVLVTGAARGIGRATVQRLAGTGWEVFAGVRRVATPLTGAYNASKFAIEGLADALRLEVRPWGVRVVLIEPAQTDTDVWRKADDVLEETLAGTSEQHKRLYAKHI